MKKKKSFWAWLGGAIAVIVAAVFGYQHYNNEPAPAVIQDSIYYGFSGNMAYSPLPLSDTTFCDSLKSTGINVFRLGGEFMNTWNWRTGLNDDGTGNVYSLQDLKALHDRTGIKILIGLNMFHSREDQLEMLRTCDTLGILWGAEYGNEFNDIGNPGRIVFPTASAYKDSSISWLSVIKKEFPNLINCGIGEDRAWEGGEHWNDTVMTAPFDALSTHIGVDPDNYIFDNIINYEKLDSLLQNDWTHNGFDTATFPIWCTEYNWRYYDKGGLNQITPENQYLTTLYLTKWITNKGVKLLCVRAAQGEKQGAFLITKASHAYTIKMQPTGAAMKDFLDSINLKPVVGIMPYDTALSYGVNVSRRVAFIDLWRNGKPLTDTILLNICNSYRRTWATDTTAFKQKIIVIANTLKPAIIAIENEELRDTTKNIVQYCNELTAAVNALAGGLQHKVINGGFTLPLYYWYWSKTHDTGFFQYCIPQSAKQALLRGYIQIRINNCQYELDALKGLKSLYAINIHFYVSDTNQFAPLKRMIEYVKNYTGHEVISNEVGIYKNDVNLLKGLYQMATEERFSYLIFYSGIGTEGQLPPRALLITKEYFNSLKQ